MCQPYRALPAVGVTLLGDGDKRQGLRLRQVCEVAGARV
jgi:hypothetical protein